MRPCGVHARLRAWSVLGAVCDFLPLPDNRVTLGAEADRHELPVARMSYSQCDHDRSLVEAATEVLQEILRAAGAGSTMTVERYAHLVGGARLAASADQGVVNAFGRSFAIPNLWIAGGSSLPTQGSANPALTIMAMAARIADDMPGRAVRGPAERWGSQVWSADACPNR